MTQTKHCCYSYSIDAHPDPEACFDWMREHWDLADMDLDDYMNTLRGFCNHYDLTLADWSVDALGHRGEFVKIEVSSDLEEMAGVRLWKYLQRHYATYRCQYTGETEATLDGNCPFTGMCYDESSLDPMREFMRKPDSRTWRELADDCVSSLITALHRDGEYRYSDEALREDCEANEYEFYEDGSVA